MDHGLVVDIYVFVFTFCVGYAFAGKRTILRPSTLAVLFALFLCGLAYLVLAPGTLHDIATVATVLCNVLFLAFGLSDYLDWLHERAVG